MRLTLRTLLAWLDDMLPPEEVHVIGKQVSETPSAQELVERIRKVARQRRLTVPEDRPPEGTDANIVASYLDGTLSAEEVVEYEKLCLKTDVNLAEVASVHQILSLIGQKAKVPVDARYRMARLKGRGVGAARAMASESPPPGPPSAMDRLHAQPLPAEPARSSSDRLRLIAGILAALLLMGVSAWFILRNVAPTSLPAAFLAADFGATNTNGAGSQPPLAVAVAPNPAPAPTAPSVPTKDVAATDADPKAAAAKAASNDLAGAEATPKTIESTPSNEDASAKADANAKMDAGAKAGIGAGNVAQLGGGLGVVLRSKAEDGKLVWERLAADSALKDKDRLVILKPSRYSFKFPNAEAVVLGPADLRLRVAGNAAARWDFAGGRMTVTVTEADKPIAVHVNEKVLTVFPPSGAPVGLELTNAFQPGRTEPAPQEILIWIPEGVVKVNLSGAGASDKDVSCPAGAHRVDLAAGTVKPVTRPVPEWVTSANLPTADEEIAKRLDGYFAPGQSVVKVMVNALEDQNGAVHNAAVRALGLLEYVDLVVDALDKPKDSSGRQTAAETLRDMIGRSPDLNKSIQDELNNKYGEEIGRTIHQLLVGVSRASAREDATLLPNLVKLLGADNLAVRQLAVDTLQDLTGREERTYDPETKVEPKNWQDLLKQGFLKIED